jgi:hypothetical protein
MKRNVSSLLKTLAIHGKVRYDKIKDEKRRKISSKISFVEILNLLFLGPLSYFGTWISDRKK